METQWIRQQGLLTSEDVERLAQSHVALFGLGGVGAYVAEALVRCGIGKLTLIDGDRVALTDLNRQLIALHSTLGQAKVEVMAQRIKDINPCCEVKPMPVFFSSANQEILDGDFSYVVDAIDQVEGKILLMEGSMERKIPLIASMGTGNKKDPSQLKIADLEDTSVCPLARIMRKESKKRGYRGIKVVYSTENPIKASPPSSLSFVPSVAGLMMASYLIRDLVARGGNES